MYLYNSMTRKKEKFVPREPGKVYMYVCGITAYDYCHIGHARAAVVFDVLVRFFRYLGYDVVFVRNFTDIDDKIIKRANETNLTCEEVAEKFIKAFYEDMDKLDILRPTYEPRATEHIKEMQDLIKILIDKKHAYVTEDGDVYFRVRSFDSYGKLSGRDIEELRAGARIEVSENKEDPLDFALWKGSKPGEPWWDSPWGKGRPGWHIECSAMSEKYLGLPLDIHGGGQDLIFPHHENERAQTVAARDVEFVNYWVHNGFVQVKGEKMSKSLGNFVTLRDIFDKFLPEVLRFFLLTKHYKTPLDFSFENLEQAEKGLKKIYEAKLAILDMLEKNPSKDTKIPEEIVREVDEFEQKWKGALEDDLNTAETLGYVFNVIKIANRLTQEKGFKKSRNSVYVLKKLYEKLQDVGQVLGVFYKDPKEFLQKLKEHKAKRKNIDISLVEELIKQRIEARKNKDFKKADEIREKLTELGVIVKDTPTGTNWDVE